MSTQPPMSEARLEDLQYWKRIKALCEARRKLYRAQRQVAVLSKVLGFDADQALELSKKGPDSEETKVTPQK